MELTFPYPWARPITYSLTPHPIYLGIEIGSLGSTYSQLYHSPYPGIYGL